MKNITEKTRKLIQSYNRKVARNAKKGIYLGEKISVKEYRSSNDKDYLRRYMRNTITGKNKTVKVEGVTMSRQAFGKLQRDTRKAQYAEDKAIEYQTGFLMQRRPHTQTASDISMYLHGSYSISAMGRVDKKAYIAGLKSVSMNLDVDLNDVISQIEDMDDNEFFIRYNNIRNIDVSEIWEQYVDKEVKTPYEMQEFSESIKDSLEEVWLNKKLTQEQEDLLVTLKQQPEMKNNAYGLLERMISQVGNTTKG